MKSIIKNSIYAGLGLLGDGTDAAMDLGREVARKAGVSEAQGERIARKFQASHASTAVLPGPLQAFIASR